RYLLCINLAINWTLFGTIFRNRCLYFIPKCPFFFFFFADNSFHMECQFGSVPKLDYHSAAYSTLTVETEGSHCFFSSFFINVLKKGIIY
ncbi:hypothetical protein LINPERPRIM_LOCUS33467, partial [Linum perenne]